MADKHIPHIKRHTEGTSNELSFDVLEAASNELDSGKRKKGLFGFGGGRKDKATTSTPTTVTPEKTEDKTADTTPAPVVSATPASVVETPKPQVNLTPQDEINRRKKIRRTHYIRTRVVIALVVALAVGGIAFFAYNMYQDKQTFEGNFKSLVDRFAQTDITMVEIDSLMANPFDADGADKRSALRRRIPSQVNELKSIQDDASALLEQARTTEDSVAVNQLVNAAAARVVMAQAADATFELADMALEQISEAKQAWNQVTEADQMARSGIASSNQAYDQNSTAAARDELQLAQDTFVEASYRLTTLNNAVEELDLSPFLTYVDKRIEALGYAIATSDALLAGDRDTATYNNDAYNAADQEAAALANQLPMSIEPTVKAVYDAKIAEFTTTYAQAREQASESDSVVRQYLG